MSAGSSGAMASTNCASSSVREAPNTAARVTRSWARKSTWSPAREASAASSSAASIDQSSRGHPPGSQAVGSTPTRPAEVRPVSSTMTTRAVPLGPPGPDHHIRAAGGRPPVDGADVVADDVLTQRVELGSVAADQHRQQPVDLAQLGQPRR